MTREQLAAELWQRWKGKPLPDFLSLGARARWVEQIIDKYLPHNPSGFRLIEDKRLSLCIDAATSADNFLALIDIHKELLALKGIEVRP